ncbi:hypothetical protein MKX01_020465 [Papaver californicum]|nr:hypothetical protein MKX01_020465 [Papaver californicum]
MKVTDSSEVNVNDLTQRNFTVSKGVLKSLIRKSSYHSSPWVIHDTSISTSFPKESGDNVECLGIDNTRRKIIGRKEPENNNNVIRRKKAKKGFQIADDNNFIGRAPPIRDFGVLEKYVPSNSYFSDDITIFMSKDSIFLGSFNKLISTGYLHLIIDSKSDSCLNSSNWTSKYEVSSKASKIPNICKKSSPSPYGIPIQDYKIPRKPPWSIRVGFRKLNQDLAGVLRIVGLSAMEDYRSEVTLSIFCCIVSISWFLRSG